MATPLTPDTLTALRASGRDAVVLFFAEWCGHCTNFKPTFDDFARASEHVVAKLDMHAHRDAMRDLHPDVVERVQGFPTVLLFRGSDAQIFDFKQARTVRGLATAAHRTFAAATSAPAARRLRGGSARPFGRTVVHY